MRETPTVLVWGNRLLGEVALDPTIADTMQRALVFRTDSLEVHRHQNHSSWVTLGHSVLKMSSNSILDERAHQIMLANRSLQVIQGHAGAEGIKGHRLKGTGNLSGKEELGTIGGKKNRAVFHVPTQWLGLVPCLHFVSWTLALCCRCPTLIGNNKVAVISAWRFFSGKPVFFPANLVQAGVSALWTGKSCCRLLLTRGPSIAHLQLLGFPCKS